MNCNQCNLHLELTWNICPNCGDRIKLSEKYDKNIPKIPYDKPYGIWNVTTEGDCEGRSSINLGIYEGYIDDIAKALASQAYYKLTFSRAKNTEIHEIKDVKKVHIALDVKSGLWDLSAKERADKARKIFKGRAVKIDISNYHAAFILEWD